MGRYLLYDPSLNFVFWDNLLKIQEFKALQDTPQNILWHKEGNAYIHTCKTTKCMLSYINNATNLKFKDWNYREILVLSALLHDIGKPITTEKGEDGLYHCKDHAIKGVPIAENILNQYVPHLKDTYKQAILSLIRNHMRPLYILNSKDKNKTMLRIANDLKNIDFESLLLLKRCDCEGAISEKEDNHEQIFKEVLNLYYKICSYPSGTKVLLKKLSAAEDCEYKFENHPNGINSGYTTQGLLLMPITVGFRTILDTFSTSPVTKIIDKNHFLTKNSLYEITNI